MEVWKPVPRYEGLYEVSNLGRVKSLQRYREICGREYLYPEKMLKLTNRGNGYLFVGLCREGKTKYESVHRLVLIAFSGERTGLFACHNNGNKQDNRLENLRWDTPKNNTHDRVIHGTDMKGEEHPMSKMTDEIVKIIRSDKRSASELAKLYGVSDVAVCNVRNRKTWKHI